VADRVRFMNLGRIAIRGLMEDRKFQVRVGTR
jgi:hypothetical protein